ncbi:hypothetical protein B0J13DRAFT_648679 [Dactylonectria estremocensis]|uniref:Uncharacterized protein n=1 Tax=Dactylonectria estremocensis TaxID=1079267 RepID=A0A9P9IJT1_9HYPO|nr:hypothetical protein B0J13DRAFT_648679 [Dactylonectria estremocensis]
MFEFPSQAHVVLTHGWVLVCLMYPFDTLVTHARCKLVPINLRPRDKSRTTTRGTRGQQGSRLLGFPAAVLPVTYPSWWKMGDRWLRLGSRIRDRTPILTCVMTWRDHRDMKVNTSVRSLVIKPIASSDCLEQRRNAPCQFSSGPNFVEQKVHRVTATYSCFPVKAAGDDEPSASCKSPVVNAAANGPGSCSVTYCSLLHNTNLFF